MAEKIVKDSQGLVNDLVNDTISRQAAVDIVRFECGEWEGLAKTIVKRLGQLPSVQSEQTKMIKEIRRWINSGNRGSADYFIIDKIEEIINKYEE